MDFRDYDPAIGRWLGIDPVTHFDQSPYMGMNGNPVMFADPSGADGIVYGMAGQSAWSNPYSRGHDSFGNGNYGNGNYMPDSFANNIGSAWGDGGLLATTYYGAEAINVFNYFAMANGYTRGIFTYKTAETSGGIGGGFIDYTKTGKIKGDRLNIYGNDGDALAGNGIGFGRGSGSSIDGRSMGGGVIESLFNLGQVFGMFLNWVYGNNGVIPTPTPQFHPQPFSITVPINIEMQLYDYASTNAFYGTSSFVVKGRGRDTTVNFVDSARINNINKRNFRIQQKISD